MVGAIAATPWRVGVVGLLVRLPHGAEGFIDMATLPVGTGEWPKAGEELAFEVLACRPGQVRLWPVEFRYRRSGDGVTGAHAGMRHDLERFPVGCVTEAVVREVFRGGQSCWLELPDSTFVAGEWDGEAPVTGDHWTVRIVRHGPSTRRLIVGRV